MPCGGQRGFDRLMCDGEQRGAGGGGAVIYEIENGALWLADDGRMRLRDKVTHSSRMPVIASRRAAGGVHPLLDYSPSTISVNHKGVQIKLEAVGDGVVVNPRGQATDAGELVAIEASTRSDCAQLVRRLNGVTAAPAAHCKAKFPGPRVEAALKRTHNRGGNARRMPIHAHDGAERLKPEGVAEPRKKLVRAIGEDDVLDDRSAE